MKCETVVNFKDTLTSSIPITEELEVREHKDTSKVSKDTKCICGCTKNLKYVITPTSGELALCRECRKPYVIDITARSLITQVNEDFYISNIKVLEAIDLISEIVDKHPIVRVSRKSTGLEHRFTRSKTVDIKNKFGLKLSDIEPVVTIIG